MKLGKSRFQMILQPISGKAVPVYRGEVLRIAQVVGGQCVDFNAFNLHDYKEHMSVGHSRQAGLHLREGDTLVSNPPRHRPMLYIAHMPPTCVGDTLGARCDAVLFERLLGFAYHTNCQDTLAEAIREYDLTPDDVHDSFNMFFNTRWNEEGAWWVESNSGRKGDYVDLLACMDTLCVPITCGSGDVQLTSNFFLKPLEISVFEPTREALARADEVEEGYAAPKSRKKVADYRVQAIRAERELTPNPGYLPEYPRAPLRTETLTIEFEREILDVLAGLVKERFAEDTSDATRRAFMRWFLATRTLKPQEKRATLFKGGLHSS